MASVLNRVTKEFIRFVNTPDYPEEDWIINPVIPEGVDPRYLAIQGDELVPLQGPEKDAVDAEVLMQTKVERATYLVAVVNDFIQKKYSLEHQQTIGYLMDEAERLGLSDRFSYYDQVGAWAKTVLVYYYTLFDAVIAATTLEEVAAVTPEFKQFYTSDPGVKIRAGLAIAS